MTDARPLVERLQALRAFVTAVLPRAQDGDCEGALTVSLPATGSAYLDDPTNRRQLLRSLGLVETRRGRGAPTWATDPAGAAERTLGAVDRICRALDGQERVSNEALEGLVPDEEVRSRAVMLLKALEMAVGIQRAGGLRRYAATQDEAEALASAEAPPPPEQPARPTRADEGHERAYYEYVADKLDLEGWDVTITGVRQRRPGQWGTPDLVGFKVLEAPALLAPIVRIVTVEVKHVLDLTAIAEAEAHQRFAHYSYLAVPQASSEISPALITELTRRGLGLICPRQRSSLSFFTHTEPPLHRPDEARVEELLADLTYQDGELPMSVAIARQVRRALAAVLAE
ncbi:MAG TPA: hypothetical protein PLU22_04475 [Polyangiaceae bacterium]|mgnify:CR=1 FL=1|nr:hypothetical protein [Polyangiaceae bacterium]